MNNAKGETRFVSDGKTFVLKFTFNALCDLEDAFQMSIHRFLAKMEADSKAMDFSFRDLRIMMRCGLAHSDPEISTDKAGQIIEGVGDRRKVFDIVSTAMMEAFGAEDDSSKKAEGNPEQTS